MTQIGRWHWSKLDYVPDLASWVCTHTLRAHVIYFLQSSNKPMPSLHWSAPHSPAPWKTQSDGVCFFQSPPVLKYQCLLPENNLAQLTSHETRKTNMCIAFLNHFLNIAIIFQSLPLNQEWWSLKAPCGVMQLCNVITSVGSTKGNV